MNVVVHQLGDLLRLIGLRDRLRCPRCKAVGTWKPHGGWLDREDVRKVRRWLCKWCGLYYSPSEGWLQCELGPKAWQFYDQGRWEDIRGPDTPQNRARGSFPWRG